MAQKTNPIIIMVGVLAAFAFGVLTGRVLPSADRQVDEQRDAQILLAPQQRADREDGEAHAFQNLRGENARRPAADKNPAFAYNRLLLKTDGDTPQACLQFNRELVDNGSVDYGDYLRLSPAIKPAIAVDGTSLCLSGLSFNQDYAVQLRPGLPAADGKTLARGDRVVVAFGDKPAYVGFAGDGVVLPRHEADGLGIETVNVSQLEISIRRVSDRAIAQKSIVKGEALSEEDYYYVYGREDGEDAGALVYEGKLAVDGDLNETQTTVFGLGAALENLKPGAYFIRLRDISPGADKRRAAQAWRWVMFTDLALTTYSSSEGVDVFVRSIANARPVSGVELTLVAQNNDLLAKAVTNGEGRARFAKEAINGAYPQTPRMIMAYGPQDDYAVLDLQRAPLDLSDRDIAGRFSNQGLDAFVYFDRGVYRPGETVHLSGLLRDQAGLKAGDRPLTVTFYRPNNTKAIEQRVAELSIGGFSIDYALPMSSPRGSWRVEVQADGVGSVGRGTFSVEDFVPQRLAVTLKTDEETPMRAGTDRRIAVESRFLYGAPAAGLVVEAEARLRLDPNPFPDFKGFRFGPVDQRFSERFIKLPNAQTGPDGSVSFPFGITELAKNSGLPMRADLVVGVVEPGGRVVRESARIPVRPDTHYLGLKLDSESGGFGKNVPAKIQAILLDWKGQQVAGAAKWRLVEEDYWFDWYRQNGEWRWRRSYKDILIAEGRTDLASDAPGVIQQKLDPGSYRLVATDEATGTNTAIRFYVGWRSYASGAVSPDQASFTLPQEPIKPGSRARLMLSAPYEGEAIVTVATDRVQLVKRVKVDPKGREVVIDTDASWGAGFYVLASVVTPRDPAEQPVPRRALGVGYVPFNMADNTLRAKLDAPEVVAPRQQLDIQLQVEGAARGTQVMATLAAVDEGILRLTKFSSPDPLAYYFGKRALGVEVRDDYGRMLHANLGAPQRFGGDQIGGEGLTVVPTKSVALFSGPVTLGDNGKATIPVTLPDFNGELRLMAVVWSQERIGASSQPMTVRDPVPALLALPRFLGPGDEANATLTVDNVDGARGEYRVTLSSSGPVALDESESIALAKGMREDREIPLSAAEEGIANIALRLSGPKDLSVTRSYPIQIRSPFYPETNISTAAMQPGEKFMATDALLDGMTKGSGSVTVSFSSLRGVDPGALLDSLYRYPYGCTEQLTSTAGPLLYVNQLGAVDNRDPERAIRPRVQNAINTLLSRQGSDGAFGLWREGDGYATPWIGVYATAFLQQAKAEGYGVPDEALERAYDALDRVAKTDRWAGVNYRMRVHDERRQKDSTKQLRRRAAAYASYVLARAERANLSDLRYFHDALLADTNNPLAKAHIGAALALMGDRARALSAFEQAVIGLGYDNEGNYYQTPLRDTAAMLALAFEVGFTEMTDKISAVFNQQMKEPARMHTQEKAFVLLAAQAMVKQAGPLTIKVGDEMIEGLPTPSFSPALQALEGDGVLYENRSDGQIYRTVSISGKPAEAPVAVANGFDLSKRILTRDGRPVDLATVRQNDRLVVAISGQAQADRLHPAIIADLLPPGFEIETVLTPSDGAGRNNSGPYGFLGKISRTKIAEARDDRFVAALDVYKERFTLAYIVRAVTPGRFTLPGAVVEDMYRPGVVGRTQPGRLVVSSGP